jgi:hypothetical protein
MAAAPTPWYREPWPWILIALPGTVVVAGIVTAVIAVRGFDGPVAEDYYKQGLAINQELGRSKQARELGIVARLGITGLADGERLQVDLESALAMPPAAALQVRLLHPGRAGEDRVATLSRIEAGPDQRSARYVGTWVTGGGSTKELTVAWNVVVETREWRLDDSVSLAGAGAFELRAR